MSSPFAARRKARVIAQDDGEEDGSGQVGKVPVEEASRSSLDTMICSCSDLQSQIEG